MTDRFLKLDRRGLLAAAALLGAAGAMTMIRPQPALAHHGWSSFDTRYAYFATGTVTYIRWGNPHSEVRLKIAGTALPADWSARPLPAGASESDGRATMVSARPYGGEHEELHLVLAGPEWMERWGLDRPLAVSVADWDLDAPTPLRARAAAIVSASAWTGVIFAGRFLAY